MTTGHHELDVEAVLAALTLEEKAALSLGGDIWHTAAVERLGIESIMVSDGPHGLRAQFETGDQVGIGDSVPATCFPTASAIASSWDPDLVRRVGEAIGREALAYQVSVVLGPGVNMKRSPLCGRNFEYLSEDPHLAGVLACAMVEGIQSQGVGTSLKHFAANNQETDRMRVSAEIDPRTLREIYLPAFERVVTQAAPWTVMCSYNKINGSYASQHHWLLTELLRDEWGYDGLVVSDWGAVHDRPAAVAAGLDLEMPPRIGNSDVAVVEAVRSGALAEADLDRTVRRVLELVARSRRPRRSSRAGPGSGPAVGRPAQERRRSAADRPGHRQDRGDRGTGSDTTLPGRRLLPGQPDQDRHCARRVDQALRLGRHRRVRSRVSPRRCGRRWQLAR
jgi:beta-glucosidase